MIDKGTSLGKVRGVGVAHEGTGHWLKQRVTAAGNLFAMTFFIVSLLLLPSFDGATVTQWLSGLIPSTMLILLVVSLFWHARMGLQVMIEDYVRDTANRFVVTVLLNLLFCGGAVLSIVSILKIALGTAA